MESVTENVNGNVRQTTPSLQEAGICKLTKGDKDGDMRMLMKRRGGIAGNGKPLETAISLADKTDKQCNEKKIELNNNKLTIE